MSSWPRHVCIVGLGLIGGSLALAIRRFHPEIELRGLDADEPTRTAALERQAVHTVHADIETAVTGCDLVVLAVPVDAIVALLPQLVFLPEDVLVTDVGSVKTRICREGRQALGRRFVGGHPLTGAEHSGLQAADPFLFENALYALTPHPGSLAVAKQLGGFLETLGAQVVTLTPKDHDAIVAQVSHVPQLLAIALCDLVREKSLTDPLYRELAAGGFRDLTRVAASSYSVWSSILKNNQPRVDAALGALQERIQTMRDELKNNCLGKRFERAASFRRELPLRSKGILKPLHRIALVIEDRPGALVEALQVLAQKSINVKDLELRKSREGDGNTFHFYVESPEAAEQGVGALRDGGWEAHRVR